MIYFSIAGKLCSNDLFFYWRKTPTNKGCFHSVQSSQVFLWQLGSLNNWEVNLWEWRRLWGWRQGTREACYSWGFTQSPKIAMCLLALAAVCPRRQRNTLLKQDFHLESYVLRAAVSAAQVFMWWKCKAKFLMVVEGQQLLPSLALIAGFLAIIRIVNINSYTVLSCSSHSSKIMLAILHVHKHKCMYLTVWELQPFWTSPKWVPWILTSLSLSLPAQPQQDHLILPSSH